MPDAMTTTTAPIAELRQLSDRQLEFVAHRLEMQIASLRMPSTRSAALMKAQYEDKRLAVEAEIARRRC